MKPCVNPKELNIVRIKCLCLMGRRDFWKPVDDDGWVVLFFPAFIFGLDWCRLLSASEKTIAIGPLMSMFDYQGRLCCSAPETDEKCKWRQKPRSPKIRWLMECFPILCNLSRSIMNLWWENSISKALDFFFFPMEKSRVDCWLGGLYLLLFYLARRHRQSIQVFTTLLLWQRVDILKERQPLRSISMIGVRKAHWICCQLLEIWTKRKKYQ